MTKEEYLKQLESNLKKFVSKDELNDILMDYGEFFEDGRRQNKSDTEISAKLGDPEIIAKQLIEEMPDDNKKRITDDMVRLKKDTADALKSATEKIGSEVGKIKDKTVSAMKENSENGRQQDILGRIFDYSSKLPGFILKAIAVIAVIVLGVFAAMTLLGIIFVLALGAVFLLGVGVFVVVSSAAFISLISPLLTSAGIFASLSCISLGLLIILLFVFIVHKSVIFIRKKLSDNSEVKEEKANA